MPADLHQRAQALSELARPCQLCPRRCKVDRGQELGFCGQPEQLQVASACAHRGEEPALSGIGGAGTVFLAGCTLRCLYCQNHQISHPPLPEGGAWQMTPRELARRMVELQQAGCHNIEWVSPTPHLPRLVQALAVAREQGLTLPVVYNSGGYERVQVLRLLEGIVDVYLPDAKYSDPALASQLSRAEDYLEANRRALTEMWRQVGPLELDGDGVARRGVIVRHLVLPGQVENSRGVFRWLRQHLGVEVTVSLMAQYYPAHRALEPGAPRGMDRRLTRREYQLVVDALLDQGLEQGWIQELESWRCWQPDFDHDAPFEQRG